MSTRINFDDLLAGTIVTDQYEPRGIIIERAQIIRDPYTPSPGNALYATEFSGPIEFPKAVLSFRFVSPNHSYIAVSPGTHFNVGGAATLTAYDTHGNALGSTYIDIPKGSHYAFGEFFSPAGAVIASFKVSGYRGDFDGIDNLIFDDTTVPQTPDFHLIYTGAEILRVSKTTTAQATVNVIRIHGSTGGISLTASSVPTGVVISSLTPNPVVASSFSLRVTASRDAIPAQNRQLVLTATPLVPSAGLVSHTITLLVTILDPYDVQIVGIEVTQGIQVFDLPEKPDPLSTAPVRYNGVRLAAGSRTIVRVFCSLRTPPRSTDLPRYSCYLHGSRNGATLPGGPISPQGAVSVAIERGGNNVSVAMRSDPGSGAVFQLPPEWTQGTITLRAEVQPDIGFGPELDNFDSVSQNDTFVLTDIAFTRTRDVRVAAIKLSISSINGGEVRDPGDVLEDCRNLLPIADNQFAVSLMATISIDHIFNQNTESCGFLGLSTCSLDSSSRAALVTDYLRDFVDDSGYIDTTGGRLIVGIYAAAAGERIRGLTSTECTGPFWDCDSLTVAIFRDSDRPLTSAAHEIGHMLGRKHASGTGGAKNPEDWPPDQQGFIQGVGVDRRTMRVLYPRDSTPFFDFMSYGGQAGGGDLDHWVSVRGWQATLSRLSASSALTPTTSPLGPKTEFPTVVENLADVTGVVVHAVVITEGGIKITKVAPVSGRKPLEGKPSAYHIIVQDRDSNTLYTSSPILVRNDVNMAGYIINLEAVIAVSNWPKVGAVEIHKADTPVARRVRAGIPPTLHDVLVKPDSAEKPSNWTVRWQANHPEGFPLTVKLDYSNDGGNHWVPRYFGPNNDTATLPNSYFSIATQNKGRIRVRISDGFDQVSAVSTGFDAPGSGPTVRIFSPQCCETFRTGCIIYLHGAAFDDSQEPITGQSLVWFLGEKQIGTSNTASVAIKAAGRQDIRLQATDSHSRTVSQSVEITVSL
ncbi:hypothetical protein VFPPC_11412 [Pochonia chlamydosporia 170]|uniref:Uncharacterized protein n=1 Tax=Pochonia chlamydosporia 170 TaxID=1380566 RepID=A0A179EWS1_METCM|nr:hypothetical protein VFPPC_11412 [Pochonia chlamydosporia 170]OAQ57626.1 hypothetical protein VFPPC_11412 [Pochonia chlamydosporia 170]